MTEIEEIVYVWIRGRLEHPDGPVIEVFHSPTRGKATTETERSPAATSRAGGNR